MSDNLKQKMLGALIWSAVDRFGQQIVQFVIILFLGRLIIPADFGLIGDIMLFVALSNTLVDSGFVQALVRKQDVSEKDYNSVFYFNILIGIVLYIVLFFSAPLIADFYKEPKLIEICRVVFVGILFNALYLIPVAKMTRKIDFKNSAKINIISVTVSGATGICLAFFDAGVWALVAQQVLFHFIRMILLYGFVKWKPKGTFSFNVIRELWGFSVNLLGTSILNMIFNNLYFVIIGKFYTKNQVGLYYQANKLNETTNYSFQTILVGSTYALLVKIQNDDERFRRVFREIAKKTSLITFPVMLCLIAVAKPLISIILPPIWLPAIPYFQLLCLATLLQPLYTLNTSALNARGQAKFTFRIEFIKKALIIASVLVSFRFGIVAMLVGYVISCAIAYLVSVLYLKKDLHHYIKHQLSDFVNSMLFGAGMAFGIWLIQFLISNKYFLLSTQLVCAAIIYFGYIRFFQTETYYKVLNQVQSSIKSFTNSTK